MQGGENKLRYSVWDVKAQEYQSNVERMRVANNSRDRIEQLVDALNMGNLDTDQLFLLV